jgi:hypothetical protein
VADGADLHVSATAECGQLEGAIAMKIAYSKSGAVIPSLFAGLIYFVIAIATGASAAASIIGGIAVAVVAGAIGLIFRSAYKHRAAGLHE